MGVTSGSHILHVGDGPDLAEGAAEMLEREDDRLTVETATRASEGLERLADHDFDCIVSDYDLPGQNGIEFLETVREEYPDLPFILYIGNGGEEVASKAISAGVTDYFQKTAGTDQYALLANRINNAVEHRRAQEAVAETEQRFQTIAEHSNDILWQFTADWNDLLFINSAYEEIGGHSITELRDHPQSLLKGIHPDDRAVVKDAMEQLSAGKSVEIEYRVNADEDFGRWIWAQGEPVFDDAGEVETVVGFARDITERKQREQAIEELHSTARTCMVAGAATEIAELAVDAVRDIFDMPVNAVHVYDETEERLVPVAWTDRAEELVGVPPTFAPGEGIAWTVFETDEAQIYDDLSTVDERYNPDTEIRSEIILPLADHGVLTIGSATAGAFDEMDMSLAQTLAAHVTTALNRVEDEQELQRQNERLNEFASVVSHDLRNPLTVASGQLGLAQRECDSDYLDDVARAHDRIETLIDDLLALAREGEQVNETEPVELTDMSDGCWQTVETASAALVTETDQTIQADSNRLKQLLENLFRNAVEHAGDNVTVTVSDLDNGFYVADDGPGIPDDEREQVFDAGYSTTEDGTGFGLNIVQAIAEAHDWNTHVTDSEAGGARFEITGVNIADE